MGNGSASDGSCLAAGLEGFLPGCRRSSSHDGRAASSRHRVKPSLLGRLSNAASRSGKWP